jgi:hypothetical protein
VPPAGEHADDPETRTDLVASAAPHAELGTRQADEAMAPRFEVHRLQQRPRLALAGGTHGERGLGRVQAGGEVVAQHLELAQVQQARTAAARNGDVDRVRGEAGDERGGEVALEPGDLVAQRAARGLLELRPRGRQRRAGHDGQNEVVGQLDHAVSVPPEGGCH